MDDFGLSRNRYDVDDGTSLNADELLLLEAISLAIIEAIKDGMDPKKAVGVGLITVCGITKNLEGDGADDRLCMSFLRMKAS